MPYNRAEGTKSITVYAVAITIEVSPKAPWTAGQTLTIRATLTKDGAPWAGETISFIFASPEQDTLPRIDTTVIGSAVTDANGVASFNWTVPWKIDTAQVPCRKFNYVGAWHQPSGAYKWYGPGAIAFPTRISITAPDRVAPNQSFTISGKLEYESDSGVWSPLAGKTVSLYYNTTKIADVTTASDGTYSATASIPTSGTYTLKASYAGEGFTAAALAVLGVTVSPETKEALSIAMPLIVGAIVTFASLRAKR
jgi:hypothetical protein